MVLSVFIPGFQGHPAGAGRPRLPSLERMVARGAAKGLPSPAEFLAPEFGLEPRRLQPAPFMALADGGNRDGHYRLCASFVHLAPDRDQLVLLPGSLLEVQAGEVAALTAAFNQMYGAEGWMLESGKEGRAYLRSPVPLDAVTHEPEAVAGRAVLEFMPDGKDAGRLKQIMTETQMLFHAHAVNRAREEADRPLINSLWLWGGGALPESPACAPKRVMADVPLVLGLALWAGLTPEPASAFAEEGLLALALDDPASLERDWFAPLFAALKSGKLQRLVLYLGGLGVFELDAASARRFWRLARPLKAP